MRTLEVEFGGARLLVLGSVRGLLKEAEAVRVQFERFAPEAVALPVGPRELEEIEQTLRDKEEGGAPKEGRRKTGPTGLKDEAIPRDPDATDFDDFGLFVSSSDMVFMRRLARFGDVEMPPPSYQEAVRLGRARGLPTVGVDLDDEAYTDAFIANISIFALWRQGSKLNRMAKRKFKAQDAEAFALEWDGLETRVAGYKRLQKAREEKMAAGVAAAAFEHKRLLVVVEVERMAGMLDALRLIDARTGRPPAGAVGTEGASPSRA